MTRGIKLTITNKEEKYKKDKRFLKYYFTELLYSYNKLTFDKISKLCANELNGKVSNKWLYEYLDKNFNSKKKYSLNATQLESYNNLLRVEHLFYYYQNQGEEVIKKDLQSMLSNYSQDINTLLALTLALNNTNSRKPDDYNFMVAFNIINNLDDYYRKIDYLFNTTLSFEGIEVANLVQSKDMVEVLNSISVKTITDLLKLSNESLLAIFCINIDHILTLLNKDDDRDIISTLKNITTSCFSVISTDPRNFDIFYEKNGIVGKPMTLEAVGKKYNITRERVRQICNQCYDNIEEELIAYEDELTILFSILLGLDKHFITRKELNKEFNDELLLSKLCFLCCEYDQTIKYDKKYEIFYNSDEYDIEEIVNSIINKIGDAISVDRFNELDICEQNVVLNDYRITNKDRNLYVLNKLSYPQVTVNLLEEIFPNGFKLSNDDDFEFFCKKFEEKFGESPKTSNRAIEADLVRYDFTYIDRGTVQKRCYLPELPDELVNQIEEYILEKNGNVYYTSIYEKFENDLKELGIDNRYYLKGLLDNKLSSNFLTYRDYINTSDNNITPFMEIYNFILNHKGIVTVNELRQKYNNVEDYVFSSYISKIDNVIWIEYMEQFILADNVFISKEKKNTLSKCISDLFNNLGTDVLLDTKLHAKLKLTSPTFFEGLEIFNNKFAFFSLVNYLFKDEYYFRRPYISKTKSSDMSYISIIKNYVKTLNKFNNDTIKNYTTKMHLRYLNSYLDFLIDMSDEYVQVNIDTCYKKDILQLNDAFLDNFKHEIDYCINSFGWIDTRTYNGYSSLPRIRVGWNKYFLVGIVRSYFNDDYDIEYTDAQYKKTDFIIRRS